MPARKYRSVSLPGDLLAEVRRVIESTPSLGYSSVSEFVKDALREKLEEISSGSKAEAGKASPSPIVLDADVTELVERFLRENPDLGYASATEFVREAVRQHVLDLTARKSGWVRVRRIEID